MNTRETNTLGMIGLAMAVAIGGWPGVRPASAMAATAGDVSRIDERFAAATSEEPDFRRHVLPLVGQLGCNGRACHGSFQGQGGFRLSLFGYDFKSDHENLLAGDEPRTNLASPAESLILLKPLEEIPHDGGQRLHRDTWQYRVLLRWIEAGAKDPGAKAASFVRLEVEPREIVAARAGQTWQMRAVAVWSDGVREDVTPLCRFQTNDDQVATIDEAGLVTALGPGDSHVVAFYDNGVVPVPVLFPLSDRVGPAYPDVPTPTRIDELVVQKIRKLGVVPSEICTDSEFLRRVSLDLTGTLPTADEAAAFLADTRPDKRARKIDELLERPGYAAWWATKFCDWTGNNARFNQNRGPDRQGIVSAHWYAWMQARLAENIPYDELVERIVLARSRLDGESYEDYCHRMSNYQRKSGGGSFAESPTLPYYWSRSNFRTTEERALGFAYTFLGVRIQCAQCHKHPFDQWTKDDFQRFENFFTRVRFDQASDTREAAQQMVADLGLAKSLRGNKLYGELAQLASKGKVVPYAETTVLPPPQPLDDKQRAKIAEKTAAKDGTRLKYLVGRTATALGSDEVRIDDVDDPRTILMDWMRDESNPYFARAIVNRVWAAYFNVGIVEPPDDLSLANPPSNEPLLDHLAAEFRAQGFDLHWLHRTIISSDAYQRSWQPNETNVLDERNFSRAVPRRIPAEVVYDAIRVATADDATAARLQTDMRGRAIAEPVVTPRGGSYVLGVFGRSIRESNCDCDRSMEPGLLQSVFLQNDFEMLQMIERKDGWAAKAAAEVIPAESAGRKDLQAEVERLKADRRIVENLEARLVEAEKDFAKARKKGDAAAMRKFAGKVEFQRKRLGALRAELTKAERKQEVEAKRQAQRKAASPDVAAFMPIVERAYLRTLTRRPTAQEADRAIAYLHETGDPAVATRDLLWALLNTKEFTVNH
jgi:hypothetical protein